MTSAADPARRRRAGDYLVWYDESAHKSSAQKIGEAMAAYHARFAIVADLVLVHTADIAEVSGVAIRQAANVQRNTYWVGRQED